MSRSDLGPRTDTGAGKGDLPAPAAGSPARSERPGRESIILYGAVGVGKTHVAQAIGHLAIRVGAEVRDPCRAGWSDRPTG